MASLIRFSGLFRQIGMVSCQRLAYYPFSTTPQQLAAIRPRKKKSWNQKDRGYQKSEMFDAVAELPQQERIPRNEQIRFFPNPRETDAPTVDLTPEEMQVGLPLLKKIVSSLENNGHKFLLPWNDEIAINKILNSIQEITSTTGLKVEFLVDGFIQRPKLFAAMTNYGDKTVEILDTLVDVCGFSIHDSLRMFASYSKELLDTSSEEIMQRLSAFIDQGIQGGYQVGRVVRKCPAILFAGNSHQMIQTANNLCEFFPRNHLKKVLTLNPQILLMNFDELEEKYEYIYYQMRIEPEELTLSSNWPNLSLLEIMDRHTFLSKTGQYSLPDPKRPQLKLENPSISLILDSDDDIFARQVAKVSSEEWKIYKELSIKLANLEEKEKPFERIKPSMRKAYERKVKTNMEQQDFIFGE
uniref:Mitochondrial transcription termination factor n=1 Tax=Panagrolaimus sp. JU765 TaxID=591449 RepID=A0AC34QPC5_9BILA